MPFQGLGPNETHSMASQHGDTLLNHHVIKNLGYRMENAVNSNTGTLQQQKTKMAPKNITIGGKKQAIS